MLLEPSYHILFGISVIISAIKVTLEDVGDIHKQVNNNKTRSQWKRVCWSHFVSCRELRWGHPTSLYSVGYRTHGHEMIIPNEALQERSGMAERERFELSEAFTSTVFKTVTLNHSVTSPNFINRRILAVN